MALLKDMHLEYFVFFQKEFAACVSSYVCVCRFRISKITMKNTKFTLLRNLVAEFYFKTITVTLLITLLSLLAERDGSD